MEDAPKKFFRLAPGREVRLRYAYFITCTEVVKDAAGNVTELRCTYDPATRGGNAPDGRKVKGTIHWVSAPRTVAAEVRLYDHLFKTEFSNIVGHRPWRRPDSSYCCPGRRVLGYVVYAQAFGQTFKAACCRTASARGFGAAASIVLFLLVLVIGLTSLWLLRRREERLLG